MVLCFSFPVLFVLLFFAKLLFFREMKIRKKIKFSTYSRIKISRKGVNLHRRTKNRRYAIQQKRSYKIYVS